MQGNKMKGVNFPLQCASLALAICCVAAQTGLLFKQLQENVRSAQARYRQNPLNFARPVPEHIRRQSSQECTQHPGSICMFSLLCLMQGGTSAGPCSGGVLSTCCTTRSTSPYPSTTFIPAASPARRPSSVSPPVSNTSEKPTQRIESKVTPVKQAKNFTYCGMTKAKPTSRIVGGNDAMYGEFPWQAHIKINRQQCGGVLLNNYYVLTAAHCIYQVPLSHMNIQLGVYDIQDHSRQEFVPQTFSVIEVKVHPKFQYQAAHPDRFDVALLKLDKPARYQDTVVPICLPRKDWNFQGWRGIITGWGKTDAGLSNRYGTPLLQKVDVPIITNKQCEKWHHEKGIDIVISDEMMCAGYEEGKKDACVGDSGGPLMVMVHGRWVVAGLVSAGFGCAQSRQPGIYHKVPSTVDWVRDSIKS